MPILRTEQIWLFGKRYDFNLYDCGVVLDPHEYDNTHQQKNQIVLHFTAGNSSAHNTVNYWNSRVPLPNFICKHYDDPPATRHLYGSNVAGNCTTPGHGKLVRSGNRASAHYVVELAEDRESAAQLYVDIAELVDSSFTTWHGQVVNANSIGIEHANVGNDWNAARGHNVFVLPNNPADSTPPNSRRPADYNRWFHSTRTFPANVSNLDFRSDLQAYQEEQYLGMILLLRYLCIKHRIARRFLGDTTAEKMQRWWNYQAVGDITSPLTQSKLMRFRGILSHMNCHIDKICGGPAMHRNRLFRGIIDEWWLPVQFQASERGYYTGPFDPRPHEPSYVRWSTAGRHSELFHDADLDTLQETKSYFNFDHLEWYYANGERADLSGTFPVGFNKTWHGGIHLSPPATNLKVYAAASGTIVAARLGGDQATEADIDWGSQRFILIRHCVYTEREANPGGGMRTNYQAAPKYIFTIYMHLAPFADLGAPDPDNPLWFNYWLRHRTVRSDANSVFCPNVEVSVGDWLGECGTYKGNRIIHFEVVSKDELTVAPWDGANYRIHDPSGSVLCTVASIDRFVQDRQGNGIDTLDVLRAARELRRVKSFHKSEWALANADALKPVIPDYFAAFRERIWARLKNFMWVSDAVAQCSDLSSQLCDAKGMMWHYHPFTFMKFVNELVAEDNGQVSEPDAANTNVSLENGYLTDFVSFASGTAVAAPADQQTVRPFDVSTNSDLQGNSYRYHFTRADIACSAATPHLPGPTPPVKTIFHMTLLDVLEDIRFVFKATIKVVRGHLCVGHSANTIPNQALCVLGTAAGLQKHFAGLAVDIQPATTNPASCRSLWTASLNASAQLRATCGEHGGEPSRAGLEAVTFALHDLRVSTIPALQTKLQAGTALTAAEANSCILHLELIIEETPVIWECWIRRPTQATAVELNLFTVIGTYPSKAAAEAERESVMEVVKQDVTGWKCTVSSNSVATSVRLENGGIVGVYYQVTDAEREKGSGDAWPQEGQPDLI
jgi:N-acetylmuramoyl-L-alanine amidase-like protein